MRTPCRRARCCRCRRTRPPAPRSCRWDRSGATRPGYEMPMRSSFAHLAWRSPRRRPCGRRTRTRSSGSTRRCSSSRLVDLHDRRQLGRVRRRVLDHARVGDDRGLRHRHRQDLAGAVEDVATLGRDGDRAHALAETERREVRAVAGLEVEEAHPDGGERQHHDGEDGDEAQPDGRQRARDAASGAGWCAGAPVRARDRRPRRGGRAQAHAGLRARAPRTRRGTRRRGAAAAPAQVTAAGGQGSASSSTSRRWCRRWSRRRCRAAARCRRRGTAAGRGVRRARGARPPG